MSPGRGACHRVGSGFGRGRNRWDRSIFGGRKRLCFKGAVAIFPSGGGVGPGVRRLLFAGRNGCPSGLALTGVTVESSGVSGQGSPPS